MTSWKVQRSTRGYALVIVLMTLGLITVAILSLWAFLEASALSTGEILKKRQTFYTCDGMSRLVGHLVGDVAGLSGPPTASGAEDYVDAAPPNRLRNMLPAGYTLEFFDVTDVQKLGNLEIPNGPFEGILGREASLKFKLRLRETASDSACQIDKTLALSEIALFQFGLFSALDQTQLSHRRGSIATASTYTITGRVHTNGDVCTKDGNGQVRIDRITAAGWLHDEIFNAPVVCRAEGNGGPNEIMVGAASTRINNDAASDAGGATGWVSWLDTQFPTDLLVRDKALGVGKLTVPSTTHFQPTRSALGTADTQRGTLRFLIDPPLPVESAGDKQTKMAYLADIRIIDGVWYKRDTSAPANWPGIPIWSDHAGSTREYVNASFTSRAVSHGAGRAVGQADLAATGALAWGGRVPRRYSYYAWDSATQNFYAGQGASLPLTPDAPVISYGGLAMLGLGQRVPAVMSRGVMPLSSAQLDYCAAPCVGAACVDVTLSASGNDAFCADRTRTTHIAAASAGSFIDIHDGVGARRRVRPVNFDVEAFQFALADGIAGELGAHFPAGSFNGIVWISSLWPNGWDGFTSGTPAIVDATENAIPFPLCSESKAGDPFDNTAAAGAGAAAYTMPSCIDQMNVAGAVRPWPTVVRVTNARRVNAGFPAATGVNGQLPKGLTIASNLPLFVHGGINSSSSTATDVSTPWVPVLVAGDTVSLLTQGFDDRHYSHPPDPWDGDTPPAALGNVPGTLMAEFNCLILTGVPYSENGTTRSVDLKAAVRLHEDFRLPLSTGLQVNGSIVIGYNPVYGGLWDGGEAGGLYDATERNYPASILMRFDPHLAKLENQPPGGISFHVQAVRAWERY